MSKNKSLVTLIAISLTVRLIPALLVFGSSDVRSWYRVAEEIHAGRNPYLSGVLNWPPLWPVIIALMSSAARVCHLPLYLLVKVPAIAADTVVALLVYGWFSWHNSDDDMGCFSHALWYVLNPVSIYTTSILGQFDAIAVMFSLVFLVAAERFRQANGPSIRSAISLGLGILTKTWPVFFVPLVLGKAHVSKRWIVVLSIIIGPTLVSLAILYYLAPHETKEYVLLYRSSPGWWGLSPPTGYLNYFMSPKGVRFFRKGALYLFYLAMFSAWSLTWRSDCLARSMCLVLLTFYVFTPGFGAQYLIWILPFALISNEIYFRIYTTLASIIFVLCELTGIHYHGTQPILSLIGYIGRRAYLDRSPLWLFCVWWWRKEVVFFWTKQPNLAESVTSVDATRAT